MNLPDYLQFSRQSLPVYTQSEVADSITCMAMISCFHGFKINMLSMRQRLPTGLQIITVRQIINIGNDIGFSSVLKIDLGQMAKIKTPAILHWNFNHFVVLSKVNKRGIVIHDPAKGRRQVDWEQVSEAFTGVAIEMVPTREFKKVDKRVKLPLSTFLGKVEGFGGP